MLAWAMSGRPARYVMSVEYRRKCNWKHANRGLERSKAPKDVKVGAGGSGPFGLSPASVARSGEDGRGRFESAPRRFALLVVVPRCANEVRRLHRLDG
jgi:hypothetical protein